MDYKKLGCSWCNNQSTELSHWRCGFDYPSKRFFSQLTHISEQRLHERIRFCFRNINPSSTKSLKAFNILIMSHWDQKLFQFKLFSLWSTGSLKIFSKETRLKGLSSSRTSKPILFWVKHDSDNLNLTLFVIICDVFNCQHWLSTFSMFVVIKHF